MREVVGQILDNTYDYEKGTLDFSCAKLEIEIQSGEVYEGIFQIFSAEGKYTKGYVSTTDLRMECLTTEFVGNAEEIQFCFHGELMGEGEVTKGEFVVVSNRGEYYLPYVVTVQHAVLESSIGPIKNLFHFANLAKSNWREAVKLFYSSGFSGLLQKGDSQVYLCYLGLSQRDGDEQNMEEFLIAMNKKQQIGYLVSQDRLVVNSPIGVVEEAVDVLRNGWGYTRLEVATEGSFVFTEKQVITEDDFLGNHYRLPVYVDSSLLHAGKNLGSITLKNVYGSVNVPIEVSVKKQTTEKAGVNKKYILKLMELYQRFRLKQINSSTWKRETFKIVERMVAMDERNTAARLFQAQMLITNEQYNEAGWILEHVGDLMELDDNPALEAYYLYLNTLLKKDEFFTKDVADKVMRIYKEHGQDWRVAWLLLFLSEEYNRNVSAKWAFLEEQFAYGCRSPLIYVEAIQLINMNPTLLRKLGNFELQVLNYGKKKSILSLEVLEQMLYLSERIREFSPILFSILKACYAKKRDVRILKEICTLLIKGNKVGMQFFKWYEKGVEEEIRIINIYEYYMLSMDLRQEPDIPKQVLLYFHYQNNMDYIHSAYLYYYVAKHRKEYPEIFEGYFQRIERFVAEQILKLHINPHLAYLYQEFLRLDMIDDSMAEALSYLLFAYEIQLKQPGIRSVVVHQVGNAREMIYPVTNDRVWIPLYGEDSCILFEDVQGHRFCKNVHYEMQRLMPQDKFLKLIAEVVIVNTALDIYTNECRASKEPDKSDLLRWLRLLENEAVSVEIKRDLILKVVQYYYNASDKELLSEYLENLSGDILNASQRAELVRYMVLCEKYGKAYEWLLCYGDQEVDGKILLYLLEQMIEQKRYSYEKELLDMSHRLFLRGNYSSILLQYLMDYYQGMLRELRGIWKASKVYSMERHAFCERVLIQMLFSGTYIGEQTEIFKEYVYSGADIQIEEAFLVKNCYDYFVNEKIIAKEFLTEVGRLHSIKQPISEVCKLAYLKFYADNQGEIQAADEDIIRDFMSDILQKGVRLKCLVDLKQYSSNALLLADKTIVEYRATSGCNAKLHYLVMKENGEAGEYLTESMTRVIGSVFFKEFILFYDESLQYYVTEERDGEERLTESGTCQKSDMHIGERSGKYGMINDIVISKNMQDYNTFDLLLEEYYKKEFYNQELFLLKR